jgi:hypothetical protein
MTTMMMTTTPWRRRRRRRLEGQSTPTSQVRLSRPPVNTSKPSSPSPLLDDEGSSQVVRSRIRGNRSNERTNGRRHVSTGSAGDLREPTGLSCVPALNNETVTVDLDRPSVERSRVFAADRPLVQLDHRNARWSAVSA